MALIACAECGKKISDKAVACPHCGAPVAAQKNAQLTPEAVSPKKKPPTAPVWLQVIIGLFLAYLIVSCATGGGKGAASTKSPSFDWNDALTMCQMALKNASRDPEKASVPYVENQGSGDEYYFAWGASTKMARMRNGLGSEVAASASCTVSHSQKRITSLTLDGQTII